MIQHWFLSGQLMELNINMASLDITERQKDVTDSGDPEQSTQSLRRSSRIKNKIFSILKTDSEAHNRKTDKNSRKNSIEKYYLSKEVKRLPSTLETIYEVPKSSNNEVQYMSVKKFKRVLNLDEENSIPQKHKRSKKRLMKARKITANNRIRARKKISMEVLLRKLETVEEENEKCSTIT